MSEQKLHFETLQVHAGQVPDPTTGSRAVPIYQTATYVMKSQEHAEILFSLKEFGNTYTRIVNPTSDVLEQRITALEGGSGALAVGSGAAAVTYSILNLARAGDEIVAAGTLYGGTYNLFSVTLPKLGINTVFVDPDDPDNFRKAVTDKTKAIYIESIGNPGINIIDIEKVASIAHENGIPLIVDNTFGTPYLIRPFEYGADVIVHSATKYIGGHGTSIGGLIVDGGKFDWSASGKFPEFTEPDRSYGGLKYYERFKEIAYIVKARVQLLRDTGAALSPFNSFLFLQGLETLSLRVERHVYNAQRIAGFLESHPNVSWVNYPGLKSNKYYELSKKYFPGGPGAIFTFGVKGGTDAAKRLIDNVKIFSLLANVADAKSLIIHPSSSTHAQLSEEEQRNAGVLPDMVRVSIGIEHVEDLINDLDQALESHKIDI